MNNLESGKSFSNNIAKKMAAVALVAALTVGSAGCNPKQIDSGENNNPPITGTVTPETNPTNTKPIETKTEAQLKIESTPDYGDSIKEYINGRVLYFNKEGSYLGEFVENVKVEGKETGAFALTASEVLNLQEEQLSQIPIDKPKLKVIVPLAITELDSLGELSITSAIYSKYNADVLIVTPNQPLTLLNAIPGETHMCTSINTIKVIFNSDNKDFDIGNVVGFIGGNSLGSVTNENASNKIFYYVSENSIPPESDFDILFGSKTNYQTSSSMAIRCGSDQSFPLKTTDLLCYNDIPVFISTNEAGK